MARSCIRGAIWACLAAIFILVFRLITVAIALWVAAPTLAATPVSLSVWTWCLACGGLDAARIPLRVVVLLRLLEAESGEPSDVTQGGILSSDPRAWLHRAASEKRQRFVQEFQCSCHTIVLPDAALAAMTTPADAILTIMAGAWMCPVGLALVIPQALATLTSHQSGAYAPERVFLDSVALSLCALATARLVAAAVFSSIRCLQDGCKRRDVIPCLFCCCFRKPHRSGTSPQSSDAMRGGGSIDDGSPPLDDGGAAYVLAMAQMQAAQVIRAPRVNRPIARPIPGLLPEQLSGWPTMTLQAASKQSKSDTSTSSPRTSLQTVACSMCLSPVADDEQVRLLLPCGHHEHHMECVDTWLLRKAVCPMCRTRVIPPLTAADSVAEAVAVCVGEPQDTRSAEAESAAHADGAVVDDVHTETSV